MNLKVCLLFLTLPLYTFANGGGFGGSSAGFGSSRASGCW